MIEDIEEIKEKTLDELQQDMESIRLHTMPNMILDFKILSDQASLLEEKMKNIQPNNTNGNLYIKSEIDDINGEYNAFKQAYEKALLTKSQFEQWKQNVLTKINNDIDKIWDEKEQKFRPKTRSWYNFFSNDPKMSELEQQKNKLEQAKQDINSLCVAELLQLENYKIDTDKKQASIQNELTNFNKLNEKFEKEKEEKRKQEEEERRKQEEEKRKQEEEERKQEEEERRKQEEEERRKQEEERRKQEEEKQNKEMIRQQIINNRNIALREKKGGIQIKTPNLHNNNRQIHADDIYEIYNWLINEQKATNFSYKDIVEQFHEFGVNNCNDFKKAFLQEVELTKMQEFIQNKKHMTLSKKDCQKLMQKLGVKSVAELREQMNEGAQEMVETIYGKNIGNIKDKLHNDAKNISDYVECINGIANDKEKPLIKKTDINFLQREVDELKYKKDEKNIFIQILMLLGYDPDGLVTAYHIAKNRLKEAKRRERDNILINNYDGILTNDGLHNNMYSGNQSLMANNNNAHYNSQSIQKNNTIPGMYTY